MNKPKLKKATADIKYLLEIATRIKSKRDEELFKFAFDQAVFDYKLARGINYEPKKS